MSGEPRRGGILHCCVSGDLEGVRRILEEDPSQAAARDGFIGSTPLHFASHRGYEGIVELLLRAGGDLAARERASGTTPLHWAAEAGHPGVARRLLDAGAALDPEDDWFGLAPLGWGAVVDWEPRFRKDRAGASALLRARGARPDLFTALLAGWEGEAEDLATSEPSLLARRLGFVADGMQPLHFAVSRELLESVAGLHDAGADPFAVTDSGMTPLAVALRDGRGAAEALLRGRGLADDLACAVVTGDLDLAGRLAKRAATAGELTGEGRFAGLLHFAAECGSAGAVTVLLACGADPVARRRRLFGEIPVETPPLHLAASSGCVEAARALLDAGADVNATSDGWGQTPLHRAAWEGDRAMVELLLAAGADPSVRDSVHCATPADWARTNGKEELARGFA